MSQKHLLSEIKLFLSHLSLLLKVKCCLILLQMTFIFSETVMSWETLNCFPSPLVSWRTGLFGQDVDSRGHANLPGCSVGGTGTFHLPLIWASKTAWASWSLEAFPFAIRVNCSDAGDYKNEVRQVRLCLHRLWWWQGICRTRCPVRLPGHRAPAWQVAFRGRVSLNEASVRACAITSGPSVLQRRGFL